MMEAQDTQDNVDNVVGENSAIGPENSYVIRADSVIGPDNSYAIGGTSIGFIPSSDAVVVYTPPVERESEVGIDLSVADSLDASYPVRGEIVAFGPYVPDEYRIGTEVLVKRYVGIQMEVDGDPNYWYFDLQDRQIMGRFIESD